jgi:hypothetical protein
VSATITIPADLEQKIAQRAASKGLPLEEYVRDVLRRDTEALSLEDILAPVRAQFAASGISEEDLDIIAEEERQAIWDEKHREKP